MDDRDIKKLLGCYEEECGKSGILSVNCLTLDEYFKALTDFYHSDIADNPLAERISLLKDCVHDAYSPVGLGIYLAFKARDMSLLNDALYTFACISHNGEENDWGDHAYYAYNILPVLLAANCAGRVPLLVPKSFGLSRCAHNAAPVTRAKMNLLMAVWYGDPEFVEAASGEAAHVLKAKIPACDRASICYLLALLDNRPKDASRYLSEFCKAMRYARDTWLTDAGHQTKVAKAFCVEAHGLFNLAHYTQNGALDGKIAIPDESVFSRELAQWQVAHGYAEGKMFLTYPKPLELVNTIFTKPPPENTLYRPNQNEPVSARYRDDLYTDSKEFNRKLIEKIMAACGDTDRR